MTSLSLPPLQLVTCEEGNGVRKRKSDLMMSWRRRAPVDGNDLNGSNLTWKTRQPIYMNRQASHACGTWRISGRLYSKNIYKTSIHVIDFESSILNFFGATYIKIMVTELAITWHVLAQYLNYSTAWRFDFEKSIFFFNLFRKMSDDLTNFAK